MDSKIKKCSSSFGLELINDYPKHVVDAQEAHERRLIGRLDKKPVAPQYVWERVVHHKWTWDLDIRKWTLLSYTGA